MNKYSWIAMVSLCLLLFFFLNEVQSEKSLAFDTYIAELFSVGKNTFSFTFFKSITYLGKIHVHWFWELIMCSIFVDNKEGLLDHGGLFYRDCRGGCIKQVDKKSC